jgi:hypothetical protein
MIELAVTDWRYGPRTRAAWGRRRGAVGDGLGMLVGGDGIVGDGLGMLVIVGIGVAGSAARQAERIARAMTRTRTTSEPETTAKIRGSSFI